MLIDPLNKGKEHIKEHTKLPLTHIHNLLDLLDFHLAIAVLSECYLQKIECKAIMEALHYKIATKTFRQSSCTSASANDSHGRFQERYHADKFLEILNKQDPAIKYTVELEDHKHSLLNQQYY